MQIKKSKQVRKYLDSQDKTTRERLEAALNNLPAGDATDYQDRNLTQEELSAHVKALEDDEWYD